MDGSQGTIPQKQTPVPSEGVLGSEGFQKSPRF